MNEISRRLAIPTLLTTVMIASSACNTGRAAAPNASVDATPSMIEPDDEDTIPCGPRLVLQTVCQKCHQKPPVNGAPFPLVRRSDIVRVTPDGEVRALMIEQMEVGRMPLSPETIDYNSRETLLDWLHAGAPAESPHSCEDADGGADEMDTRADAPPGE
ncbi:MAG TPA: hypothetical protein VM925_10445 [Labilithrix sp.]|nr:hypothetical protein [Labilithrix sp.]